MDSSQCKIFHDIFESEEPSRSTLFSNGRRKYPFSVKSYVPSPTEVVPDPTLTLLNMKPFSLHTVICAYVKTRGDKVQIPLSINNSSTVCKKFGQIFVINLVRVASENIFGHPEQSIMELPANSIDAVRAGTTAASVGRFGMGFFSVLYWLIKHPQRDMYVHSIRKDGNGFFLHVKETMDKGLSATVMTTLPICAPGTTTFMDCTEDNLSRETLDRMYGYLQRLRFVRGVRILCKRDDEECQLLNQTEDIKIQDPNLPPIYIELSKTGFRVEDWGDGIPTEALFGALLVPSLSTKTIVQSSMDSDDTMETQILPSTGGHASGFIITVNRVVIYTQYGTAEHQYILHLPARTPLTIDRTDIIRTDTTMESLSRGIETLFRESTHHNSYELETVLETYAVHSHNGDVVRKVVRREQSKRQHLLVPLKEYELVYQFLREKDREKHMDFRPSHSFNHVAVEQHIRQELKSFLIDDTRKICIRDYITLPPSEKYKDDVLILRGGLQHLLFIGLHENVSSDDIFDLILQSPHITSMSLNVISNGVEGGEIWQHLVSLVREYSSPFSASIELNDKPINKSLQHLTRRLEYDYGRKYDMDQSPSKREIAFRLYVFLRFCSLYDQKFSPAGAERRRRLADSFDTLVSTLRPDILRQVTWLITENRDYSDILL
jgi:hypothetical protein